MDPTESDAIQVWVCGDMYCGAHLVETAQDGADLVCETCGAEYDDRGRRLVSLDDEDEDPEAAEEIVVARDTARGTGPAAESGTGPARPTTEPGGRA